MISLDPFNADIEFNAQFTGEELLSMLRRFFCGKGANITEFSEADCEIINNLNSAKNYQHSSYYDYKLSHCLPYFWASVFS
ncbi:MAG: hypothetical protein ACI910_000507 [Oleispira sp.]